MCLSTVYKNTLTPETMVMRNVMRIECKDGCVILTDLMERQMAIEGTLEMANLVDGIAVGGQLLGQVGQFLGVGSVMANHILHQRLQLIQRGVLAHGSAALAGAGAFVIVMMMIVMIVVVMMMMLVVMMFVHKNYLLGTWIVLSL